MAEEKKAEMPQVPESETLQTVEQEPEVVEEQPEVTDETPEETEETEVAEKPVETEEKPQEQTPTEVRKMKLKVDGQEEEHDENEVIEFAQKGISYSKKQQDLKAWEEANKSKLQAFEQIIADPTMIKAVFARQMGIDPAVVLTNVQPPDPKYKEAYPEWYWQQQSAYDRAMMQRDAVDKGVQAFIKQSSDGTNVALLAKTKIQHDLNDAQAVEVANFVSTRLKPGMFGMYTEQDMDAAVMALYGKKKAEDDKLQTANNIREKIKRGVQKSQPRSTSQRQEELPADVAEARRFLNVIRDMNANR
jgi:hypothetical protein